MITGAGHKIKYVQYYDADEINQIYSGERKDHLLKCGLILKFMDNKVAKKIGDMIINKRITREVNDMLVALGSDESQHYDFCEQIRDDLGFKVTNHARCHRTLTELKNYGDEHCCQCIDKALHFLDTGDYKTDDLTDLPHMSLVSIMGKMNIDHMERVTECVAYINELITEYF